MLKYDPLFVEELRNIHNHFVAVLDAPSENHETDVEVNSGDSMYALWERNMAVGGSLLDGLKPQDFIESCVSDGEYDMRGWGHVGGK
jgi:hypothetical protein